MPSKLPYKQATNVERRTWDIEVYEARSQAREAATNNASTSVPSSTDEVEASDDKKRTANAISLNDENEKEEFEKALPGAQGPLNSKRAFLKSRRGKVDLESKVGSTEIINPDAAATTSLTVGEGVCAVSKTQGLVQSGVGWHCKICDCFLKDSATYLDHINGRKHQRHLGYSMRTEKSTTKDVSNKLQALARLKKSDRKDRYLQKGMDNSDKKEFKNVLMKKDEDAAKVKAERARKREERKKKKREEECQEDVDGCNTDMAAMMGFSSFGGN